MFEETRRPLVRMTDRFGRRFASKNPAFNTRCAHTGSGSRRYAETDRRLSGAQLAGLLSSRSVLEEKVKESSVGVKDRPAKRPALGRLPRLASF